jgi:hypothetical protein
MQRYSIAADFKLNWTQQNMRSEHAALRQAKQKKEAKVEKTPFHKR